METLYRFKLDPDTGAISLECITDYKTYTRGFNNTIYLQYKDSTGRHEVAYSDLYEYKHGKYITFDGNFDRAARDIYRAIEEKRLEAMQKASKCEQLLKNIITKNKDSFY